MFILPFVFHLFLNDVLKVPVISVSSLLTFMHDNFILFFFVYIMFYIHLRTSDDQYDVTVSQLTSDMFWTVIWHIVFCSRTWYITWLLYWQWLSYVVSKFLFYLVKTNICKYQFENRKHYLETILTFVDCYVLNSTNRSRLQYINQKSLKLTGNQSKTEG